MKQIFYKPAAAFAADAIPFYDNGKFHIFYLLDYRDPEHHGEGTPWFKVTTTDFVHYEDHGEMLSRGTDQDFDMYVFTGSVIKHDGLYHIFYTGHNTKMEPGNYLQAVMHAVSDDLETWKKIPEDTFQALTDEYEIRDWRDPYVFYDDHDGFFYMLLSTRRKTAAARRRGTTALLKSRDLKTWELSEPFYEPHLYYAHECPDLFQIGEWYYHVFSEFSHYHVTRYVMSKSLKGPWRAPEDNLFDGRAFYAAKTVSDGQKRYIIGWNPTKEGQTDAGYWQWGGSLVVHEVYQRPDGTLAVRMPETVDAAFHESAKVNFKYLDGKELNDENLTVSAIGSVREIISDTVASDGVYEYDVNFTYRKGTSRIGILLNCDPEKDSSYGFFFEPGRQRFVFELFPNFPQYSLNAIQVERPMSLREETKIEVKIIVEGTIAVCYVNGEYALNVRMYDSMTRRVGLAVIDGEASFENVLIKK